MAQDLDFTASKVTCSARRSLPTMFMIMLGFTFFSASMWVGQQLALGLELRGFILSILLGGAILGLYTGLLGFIGAKTGMNLDLLSRKAFGEKGSYLSSFLIAFTQIGWFGVGVAMFALPVSKQFFACSPLSTWFLIIIAGTLMTSSAYFGIKSLTVVSYIAVPFVAILGTFAMILAIKNGEGSLVETFSKQPPSLSVLSGAGLVIGSFISGGTSTPNFTRFAKSGKAGLWVTVVAFFLGNSLMFCFGGISGLYAGGNDIFEVMLNLNLFYAAILVLGLNIWTTNDNALYSAGLSLSNITGKNKRPMVLISGIIGTLLSEWLYNNFCVWLNVLSCTLPPVGAILILDFFMNKKERPAQSINIFAVTGVISGALVANFIPFGVQSINGMAVACLIYFIGEKSKGAKHEG